MEGWLVARVGITFADSENSWEYSKVPVNCLPENLMGNPFTEPSCPDAKIPKGSESQNQWIRAVQTPKFPGLLQWLVQGWLVQ